MAGKIKNKVNKVADTAGGAVGKLNAATTTKADEFVKNAAIGDLYEIEAAKIAMVRSREERTAQIARKMIADHTTSTHHLQAAMEMNETRGVEPTARDLDTRRQTMLDHLAEAPEDAFDKTYLDQQVLAHEETVTLMRNYSEGGDNAQLRSFALGTLPVVERHLTFAKTVRQSM